MTLRGALMATIMLGLGGLSLVAWIGIQLPAKQAAVVEPVVPPPATAMILTAARPMRGGDLVKYDDLKPREVVASQIPEGARVDSPEARAELVGSMIRRGLLPAEPLLPADLLRPGDHGFLAAVLRPGMRATTVGVDAVSGTGGLIWPGDHVDVLMTQITDDQTLPASRRASAQTVLGDVRVIAIDRQLMQGATGASTGAEAAHTVTLEVTDVQAGRITLAARLGRLSFLVRAAGATPDTEGVTPPTTWGGDVSSALGEGRSVGRVIRVYHGTADAKELRF
jgi:pilus assembly protein CpaB